MEVGEAIKLRKKFKNAPYEHSRNMEKETFFTGSSTGEEVCIICGLNSETIARLEEKGEKNKWCK
jgi:hypothetical protein